jgi:heme/copper-type cytochrome/quinol oxidase subunit 4
MTAHSLRGSFAIMIASALVIARLHLQSFMHANSESITDVAITMLADGVMILFQSISMLS